MRALWEDPEFRKTVADPAARDKIAAYLLPPLCAALLDDNPEVGVLAAFRMMQLGSDGRSAGGALRDALRDRDERVRKVVEIALKYIESEGAPPWP